MAKILIIDDQACIRQFYRAELTEEGYEVAVADDSGQAMTKIEAFAPDLVVLDLFLKGPNGWEAIDMIKKKYPYLPVLIATAYDSYREDPRLNEASGYIVKHSDTRELKEKVAEILAEHCKEQRLLSADKFSVIYRKVA